MVKMKSQQNLMLDKGIHIDSLNSDGDSPLIEAIQYGQIQACKVLLEDGANVNLAGEFGNTPLLIAVEFDREQIYSLLIKNGANMDLANNFGDTPLSRAAQKVKIRELFSKKTPRK